MSFKVETVKGTSENTDWTAASEARCSMAKVKLLEDNEVVGYYIDRAKSF